MSAPSTSPTAASRALAPHREAAGITHSRTDEARGIPPQPGREPARNGSANPAGPIIAALYVERGGAYYGLPGVDPWDAERDARSYCGPHPVVAHPPCERWGRFWHGSPRKPHQFRLGEDGGCFSHAITAVRMYGGVLEHPADSKAWAKFGIKAPPRGGGWVYADDHSFGRGWTCYVEQGFYGHAARKPTWLYAYRTALPELRWGLGEQRLDPKMVERHGYEYARRKGIVSMVGGKHKKAIRNATPPDFRDLLISIAATARREVRHEA